MTSAMARRLAAVAALGALLTTAACGGGGSEGPAPTDTASPTSDESGTVPEETESGGEPSEESSGGESNGEIFVGSDSEGSSASDIQLSRTRVGEPVEAAVQINASDQEASEPVREESATVNGEDAEITRSCVGEVPPCRVQFSYTPTEPGPYSGELTVTLADDATVTAPIHGEAVGEDTTEPETTESETTEPETTEPETTEPETTEPETTEPETTEPETTEPETADQT
ncbi:hypothetical protein ACFY71_20525 [Streptomyces cinerochromogenes]|uniref:hypothetical protein n=1 Tax=Streptomyces cinerochromogenes TaxID=66422 RepID=UPI0036CD9D28